MQESCSYGSVGERGGNKPLYPEIYTVPSFVNSDIPAILSHLIL